MIDVKYEREKEIKWNIKSRRALFLSHSPCICIYILLPNYYIHNVNFCWRINHSISVSTINVKIKNKTMVECESTIPFSLSIYMYIYNI